MNVNPVSSQTSLELEAALQDPAREFKSPAEVATRLDWSVEERCSVLQQWKYDIGQLHVAAEENMPASDEQEPFTGSPERVTIGDVHKAIESLGMPTHSDSGPTKGA